MPTTRARAGAAARTAAPAARFALADGDTVQVTVGATTLLLRRGAGDAFTASVTRGATRTLAVRAVPRATLSLPLKRYEARIAQELLRRGGGSAGAVIAAADLDATVRRPRALPTLAAALAFLAASPAFCVSGGGGDGSVVLDPSFARAALTCVEVVGES